LSIRVSAIEIISNSNVLMLSSLAYYSSVQKHGKQKAYIIFAPLQRSAKSQLHQVWRWCAYSLIS